MAIVFLESPQEPTLFSWSSISTSLSSCITITSWGENSALLLASNQGGIISALEELLFCSVPSDWEHGCQTGDGSFTSVFGFTSGLIFSSVDCPDCVTGFCPLLASIAAMRDVALNSFSLPEIDRITENPQHSGLKIWTLSDLGVKILKDETEVMSFSKVLKHKGSSIYLLNNS